MLAPVRTVETESPTPGTPPIGTPATVGGTAKFTTPLARLIDSVLARGAPASLQETKLRFDPALPPVSAEPSAMLNVQRGSPPTVPTMPTPVGTSGAARLIGTPLLAVNVAWPLARLMVSGELSGAPLSE